MEWEKKVKRFGPPINVHPGIKLARWAFLITGIIYGTTKHEKYSVIEKNRQVDKERTQGIRDDFIKDERSKILEAESQLRKDEFLDEEHFIISEEPPEELDDESVKKTKFSRYSV